MSLWTAIVVIVAIWGLVSVIRSRHNSASGYATDDEGKSVGNLRRERELQAEIEHLRQRLEVLERIITDEREAKRLSAEIEDLRTRD